MIASRWQTQLTQQILVFTPMPVEQPVEHEAPQQALCSLRWQVHAAGAEGHYIVACHGEAETIVELPCSRDGPSVHPKSYCFAMMRIFFLQTGQAEYVVRQGD